MKQLLVGLTIAGVMTGCVLTPGELREQGSQHHFIADRAPDELAACLERSAENWASVFVPRTRRSDRGLDVLVQIISGSTTTVALANVQPIQSGSAVAVWITPYPLYKGANEFRDYWAANCGLTAR
jgi:hypothetical protein